MTEDSNHRDATKNVHAGTNHIGESVNTPIFLSSTYKLTEERYAGWPLVLNIRSFILDFRL